MESTSPWDSRADQSEYIIRVKYKGITKGRAPVTFTFAVGLRFKGVSMVVSVYLFRC